MYPEGPEHRGTFPRSKRTKLQSIKMFITRPVGRFNEMQNADAQNTV